MSGRLETLLGIDLPIVLGPFGGVSSVELTATVSRLGGLGSYGLYGYDAERIARTAAALRAATDRPFALNLWLATGDEVRPGDVDLTGPRAAVAPFFDELGLAQPDEPAAFLPDVDDQLTAALDARPAVLSLVFGTPPAWVVERAHASGTRVVGTATTVDEARALEDAGVDAVVACGAEAAGHRVSFLHRASDALVGTFSLVPQVVDAVRVPVLAAGGVADRRGVAAARALGADGVVVGTAFLRTRQSAASDAHRAAIAATPAHGTVLTSAMSGRLSRGVPNRAVRQIERSGQVAPFPAQNWLTGQFRGPAGARDLGELQSLWLGQSAALARHDDAADVLAELAAGLA